MQIFDKRPPYVEFKQVAVEDRDASIKAGRRVTKNVNMAFIMQIGSKDQVEKDADEWIAQITRMAIEGQYPQEWADGFAKKLENWKQGLETPLNGLPVKEWSAISPAEAENLIAAKVFTVEDVAELNEQAIASIGLGTRALRDKARAWLNSGNKTAEELLSVKEDLRREIEKNEALQRRIEALESKPKVKLA